MTDEFFSDDLKPTNPHAKVPDFLSIHIIVGSAISLWPLMSVSSWVIGSDRINLSVFDNFGSGSYTSVLRSCIYHYYWKCNYPIMTPNVRMLVDQSVYLSQFLYRAHGTLACSCWCTCYDQQPIYKYDYHCFNLFHLINCDTQSSICLFCQFAFAALSL